MANVSKNAIGVLSVVVAFSSVASAVFADTLRLGASQEKITPKMGAYLGGYWRVRIAKTVKSDLFARAMVFESKGKRAAIVANDLIGITPEIAEAVRTRIAKKCGIHPDAVLICATHTHTGPEIRDRKDRDYGSDPQYNAALVDKISAVVERACNSMFEGAVYVGRGEAKGYARNRYCRLKDGRDVAIYADLPEKPPYGGDIIGYASPMDNSVQTLCFKDSAERIRAMAVNFAAHPNSGQRADYVWAEWPGDTAKRIAEEYGDDAPCLLLQGAAGDVQCTSKLSRQQVGKGIGEAAVKINKSVLQPMANPVLDWRMKIVKIPYCSSVELAEVIAYYRRKKGLTDEEETLMRKLIEFYELWDKDNQIAELPVQCLRIGDVAVAALPGEPFTALGLEIKEKSPAKHTFVVGYANDWRAAYLPPADQARRGAYGERPCEARYLVDTAARTIVDSALKSLREMWK